MNIRSMNDVHLGTLLTMSLAFACAWLELIDWMTAFLFLMTNSTIYTVYKANGKRIKGGNNLK